MLADQDRIFTNLYGQRDWGLEGARTLPWRSRSVQARILR